MIKDLVKFIVFLIITLIVTRILVLGFFFLRFWTERNSISSNWVIIINPIVIFVNGYIVYALGKRFGINHLKGFTILGIIIWIIFLYAATFTSK